MSGWDEPVCFGDAWRRAVTDGSQFLTQAARHGASSLHGKAKRSRDITFLDELPRTSVGKIRKFVLKEGR